MKSRLLRHAVDSQRWKYGAHRDEYQGVRTFARAVANGQQHANRTSCGVGASCSRRSSASTPSTIVHYSGSQLSYPQRSSPDHTRLGEPRNWLPVSGSGSRSSVDLSDRPKLRDFIIATTAEPSAANEAGRSPSRSLSPDVELRIAASSSENSPRSSDANSPAVHATPLHATMAEVSREVATPQSNPFGSLDLNQDGVVDKVRAELPNSSPFACCVLHPYCLRQTEFGKALNLGGIPVSKSTPCAAHACRVLIGRTGRFVAGVADDLFNTADKDKDGVLTHAELTQRWVV